MEQIVGTVEVAQAAPLSSITFKLELTPDMNCRILMCLCCNKLINYTNGFCRNTFLRPPFKHFCQAQRGVGEFYLTGISLIIWSPASTLYFCLKKIQIAAGAQINVGV